MAGRWIPLIVDVIVFAAISLPLGLRFRVDRVTSCRWRPLCVTGIPLGRIARQRFDVPLELGRVESIQAVVASVRVAAAEEPGSVTFSVYRKSVPCPGVQAPVSALSRWESRP